MIEPAERDIDRVVIQPWINDAKNRGEAIIKESKNLALACQNLRRSRTRPRKQ